MRNIEETNPLGPLTSDIKCHTETKALFTIKDYYGVIMTIPDNQLLLWPGCSGSDSSNSALLPEHDMVMKVLTLKLILEFCNVLCLKGGASGIGQRYSKHCRPQRPNKLFTNC